MRKLIAVSALLMLFSGGGCAPTDVVNSMQVYDPVDAVQPYVQRADKVTLSAGNAQEVNTRIHEVDPWPRNVGNTRIAVNGERMARAVERYRKQGPRSLATELTGAGSGGGGGVAAGAAGAGGGGGVGRAIGRLANLPGWRDRLGALQKILWKPRRLSQNSPRVKNFSFLILPINQLNVPFASGESSRYNYI